MKKKNRLDRGLDSLFSDNFHEPEQQQEEAVGSVSEIRISLIEPNKQQPRTNFDEEKLAVLAQNIKENGVLQPILVRPIGQGSYQIVAGERRWRAARIAGLTEMPCYVRELDDAKTAQVALIENLQREDLSPIEEAKAYRKLIDDFSMTQEQVAKAVGKSRPAVANTLRLLGLPKDVQDMVDSGRLSEGHAKVLAGITDNSVLIVTAEECAANGWSVRQLEREVKAANERIEDNAKIPRERSVKKPVPFLKEFEASVKDNSSVLAQTKSYPDGSAAVTLRIPKDSDLEGMLTKIAQILAEY